LAWAFSVEKSQLANEDRFERKRLEVSSRAHSLLADEVPPVSAVPVDAAVARLYREQQAFVWRNARRLGCADEWVDDAVQEVFLVAARRLHELTPDANLRGWLFAIVFRVVQRLQRNRARYRVRIHRYSETQLDATQKSAEDSSHAARQLRELLSRLDEAKRVVVILVELEGMTSAEVAKLLGVPQGTVDTRLRAARKRLQELIEHARFQNEGKP
jgi:RNA polymerase sigma-70 factor, ECF subfamily